MESIPTIYLWAVCGLAFTALLTWTIIRDPVASLPLNHVGREDQTFSRLRAFFRQHTTSLQTITDGYNKYNKKGLAFMLPTTAMREIVMIPQEHIGWLVNQKDDVLSVKETRNGNMALDSLLPNLMELPHGGFRYDVLRREFPRYLDVLQPIVMEELSKATETSLGLDIDGWHEVCLWQSMRKIIKPVANRLFYDYPLCEDPGFEKSTESFFSWVGIGGFVAGKLVPWPLRRFLGSLFAIPVYFHLKMSLRKLLPTVKKRVDDIKRGAHDHNSFLTLWVTAFLNANVNESVKNPQVIAERLLLMTLAADQPVVMSSVNFFLDLLSSEPGHGYFEQLREEAQSVFQSEEDWMDHTSVAKLFLTDSAIRESLRRSPLISKGLLREVVPKDGVTMPDGNHIPKGAWLGVFKRGVHLDERFYSNAQQYEPFRFASGHRSVLASEELSEKASEHGKSVSLPNTSDVFMSWGHGRHACPGRWFATHLLKMMVSYIVMNYDIEPLADRPSNIASGDFYLPSRTTNIRIKRRSRSEK